mmetsp:Transcript_19431/g.23136  ORF Transcript_19431/g.23136 Transcript_19431/m.23136 type:complete len:385 (-) Transcript_19431:110-1264(-)
MSFFHPLILSLCLGVSSASSGFSNVSHLETAVLAFGSASSLDGVTSFFPSSDGSTIGVYESFDSGATLDYLDGVGETAEAMILMAAAVRDVPNENMSVITSGLFGSAISKDGGYEWEKLNLPEIVCQDVKYESSSNLYALTGQSLGQPTVAISSDGGNNFDSIIVSGFYEPYIRYGSFPSSDTFYVTAGIWGDDDIENGKEISSSKKQKRLTSRLSISDKGTLKYHDEIIHDTNSSGYWAQVAKTVDGGKTWSIIFEDFENDLYPNDIHCYDVNTCTFVLEGAIAPQIVTTQDGGATWTRFTDPSGGVSLMAVRMTGPTEAYVSGGGDVGRMWHTADLVNWNDMTTDISDAVEIFSFALTGDSSVAYATGVLRSQLCSILKLEF